MTGNRGSLFLFEFVVSNLKNLAKDKDFTTSAKFANVFDINLRCPKEEKKISKQRKRKKSTSNECPLLEMAQSVLFESTIEELREKMKNNPLILSVKEKQYPYRIVGSKEVPWGSLYKNYLQNLPFLKDSSPIILTATEKIYDYDTSRPLVFLKLTTKISFFSSSISPVSEQQNIKEEVTHNLKIDAISETEFRKELPLEQEPLEQEPLEQEINKSNEEIKPENLSHLDQQYYDQLLFELFHRKIPSPQETSNKQKSSEKPDKSKTDEYADKSTDKPNNGKFIIKPEFQKKRNALAVVRSVESIFTKPLVHKVRSRSIDSMYRSDNSAPIVPLFFRDVYVGFAVKKSAKASNALKKSLTAPESPKKEHVTLSICDSTCQHDPSLNVGSTLSLDFPKAAKDLLEITKCKAINCSERAYRTIVTEDERIIVELESTTCQDFAKSKTGSCLNFKKELSCLCACECYFGFEKRTEYCDICGGWITLGDKVVSIKKGQPLPFPCPLFHKTERRASASSVPSNKSSKSSKGSKGSKGKTESKENKKNKGSDKVSKKKEKTDKYTKESENKFKFRTGYVGIPVNIGHEFCLASCGETIVTNGKPVPANMGWLWTATNVLGMKAKFRHKWRPGACHKAVVRMLKQAKHPGQKKQKKKKIVKPPPKKSLLAVHKKNGEIKIRMEPMKQFDKERMPYQQPFDTKGPFEIVVGKTEKEKVTRQKQKERRAKQLMYDQREYIQRSFRNMCHRVCMTTYEQALGLIAGAEIPIEEKKLTPPVSCTCSEDVSTEDTDNDEWTFGFTPPNAIFRPSYKKKVITANNSTQYNYLDYRVKLFDKRGHPVPRFFIGPDGKKECSDLGGFWGPGHHWLVINTDGFIAEDGRWAPFSFIGPGDEVVNVNSEKFSVNEKEYTIGVDGYIANGRWINYGSRLTRDKKAPGSPINEPKVLNNKAPDNNKEATDNNKEAADNNKKISKTNGNGKRKNNEGVKEILVNPQPRKSIDREKRVSRSFQDPFKCKHATPSTKGILAINEKGQKIYFTIVNHTRPRSAQRLAALRKQGIKLSSFHIPCLNSFINKEEIKQNRQQKVLGRNSQVSPSNISE